MDQVEHLAAALKMVNASMFKKDMESVEVPTPMTDIKLKKFMVKTSTADIVEAEDEQDAIDIAIANQFASPDADYEVIEVVPTVKIENGCTVVNPKAKRFVVTKSYKQYYHIPVEAIDEADAVARADEVEDLGPYLVHDIGQDYNIESVMDISNG